MLHKDNLPPKKMVKITSFFSRLIKEDSFNLWSDHVTDDSKGRLLQLLFSICKRPGGSLSYIDDGTDEMGKSDGDSCISRCYDDAQKSTMALIMDIVAAEKNLVSKPMKMLAYAFLSDGIKAICQKKNEINSPCTDGIDPTLDECGERMSLRTGEHLPPFALCAGIFRFPSSHTNANKHTPRQQMIRSSRTSSF